MGLLERLIISHQLNKSNVIYRTVTQLNEASILTRDPEPGPGSASVMSLTNIQALYTKQTRKFAKEFLVNAQSPDKTIHDLSKLVHEFYQSIQEKLDNHSSQDSIELNSQLICDNIERTLNEHIYPTISTRIINEDEEQIMAFQKRIRSLNWITVEHLEIELDFKHTSVHDLLDRAICQMVEMNSRTSSLEKLDCIVQCSKTILELLQVNPNSNSVPISADQFLPVLVFVVIQANPPMLPADIKYLTLFSNPGRLMSGEAGYYFTNLCCALEFIENVSGASLNISEEEFNQYLNGEAVPETKSKFNIYLSDGLRTICSNGAALDDLRERCIARRSKLDILREQIDVCLETNKAKLKEMQSFASGLSNKLKPTFPKFYNELMDQNKDFAMKLLPSYLRPTIQSELKLDEGKLVDIDQDCSEQDFISKQQLNVRWSSNDNRIVSPNLAHSNEQTSHSSLSPIEQLEQDLSNILELPEPMKPEPTSTPEKR